MNKLNIAALAIGIVALVMAGYALVSLPQHSNSKFGATGTGPNCLTGSVTCYTDLYASATSTGNALVSLTDAVISRAFYFGGATEATSIGLQPVTQTLTAATTTPCTLQNPFANATATIVSAYLNVTTATSSAGTIVAATSTLQNATTSALAIYTIGANAQQTLGFKNATSTGQEAVVPPGGYFTFGMTAASGASYGYYTYGGSCGATFQKVI